MMWCVLWFVFLLAVGETPDGPVSGHVTKVSVKEDQDAFLPCYPSTKENLERKVFDWINKNPRKEVFLYDRGHHYNNGRDGQDAQFKGRVEHFETMLLHGNASILIKKVQLKDAGNYTCIIPHPSHEEHYVQLIVEPLLKDRSTGIPGSCPKPSIPVPMEMKIPMKLECKVHCASEKPRLQWQDGAGEVLHADAPNVTEREGGYDVTLQLTVNRTGVYSCVAIQDGFNHRTEPSTIVVLISEPSLKDRSTKVPVSGSCPKPSIPVPMEMKIPMKLECKVHCASEKPHLQWQDGAGEVLHADAPNVTEREGGYDVTLQLTVNRTGVYSCVAIQDGFNHRTEPSTIVILISGPPDQNVIATIYGGLITGSSLVIIFLVVSRCFTITRIRGWREWWCSYHWPGFCNSQESSRPGPVVQEEIKMIPIDMDPELSE
ncbi:butyrophilin-like protein 2 [Antennarius striatus]|uniref:butyrophilin-like protein 2 n=1 Tax=Antennarius striatus TaxID=241820 RepID=UPI0035B436F8